MSNERRLVRRLKKGDERAFRELVRTHQATVLNFVYRMVGNVSEAEDIAQDVFVAVFRSIGQFRTESKLSTWIFRIAANHCHNRRKYLTRRHYHTSEPFDEKKLSQDHVPPSSSTHFAQPPDRAAETRQIEMALQQGIKALEQKERMLIILRDIQGMAYDDIAEITQLPIGTVKSRLHRARMALKDQLSGLV